MTCLHSAVDASTPKLFRRTLNAMDVVCKALCLLGTIALTTGQFFSGSNQNGPQQTFQQNSRLSMPHRSGNPQPPDPRLAAQMGVNSRLSTGMPFNPLMPTTQVTMAPGIQRSRLGSPHPQTSTKAPPISLLQFLLDTTPHPDGGSHRSVSTSPHRPAPHTTRNIQTSPFRTVQVQSTGQPLQGSRRMSPSQSFSPNTQSQPGRQNSGPERTNSASLSLNSFRNPLFQRASQQRVQQTQTFSNSPVQNQLTSQWNNPSSPQSSSSLQNVPQNRRFSSHRVDHAQTPQNPPVQQQWTPTRNVNIQPHSSNSFQNQRIQQHSSPQRVEPARTAPQTMHLRNQWHAPGSSLNQHRPSQTVEKALVSRLESSPFSSSNTNSNQPIPANHVQVKTFQPVQPNVNQFTPPYQNIAARRTALRQVNSQSVASSTTPAPVPYEIRPNLEPNPLQSSPSNAFNPNPVREQSLFNVQQNQPVSYNVPNREGSMPYMTSPNIVRNLPNTDRAWQPQSSSPNVLRSLPDTKPVTVQKPSNVVSTNVQRNLPDNRPPSPKTMETRSFNVKQTPPTGQQQIQQQKNISPSGNGQIAQQQKRGLNSNQNMVSSSLPNTQPNSHLMPQRSESLQTPALQTNVNGQQKSSTLTPKRPIVKSNPNSPSTAQQSNVETKSGLIPTVINGKKYMINPNFVHLLQNLLSKAGLDMKTGSSKQVSPNRPINSQRMESIRKAPPLQPQTQSDYEPPVTKQRIIKDKPAPTGIKAAAYTNLGTVSQSQTEGVNNQFKRNPGALEPNSLIDIKPRSPYSNTVQRLQLTTSATAAPAIERNTYTNTPSFVPKSPQTPQPTTTPLTVTTLAPKRRKAALLLPFRDIPAKQTTTKPVVKTTLEPTSPPQSAPSQRTTSLSSTRSVTHPPKNAISGTTKLANTTPSILIPRYLSDRRTVATEAPTTRSVVRKPTTTSPRSTWLVNQPASGPIPLETQQGITLDISQNSVVGPTSPALDTPSWNQDPQYTTSPFEQSQISANNELVNEPTPALTPTQESKVNVQFSFNLGHFSRNKSKKTNEVESVFNDLYRESGGLPPPKGVGVHKGFVGFNNKANNVELLVLR